VPAPAPPPYVPSTPVFIEPAPLALPSRPPEPSCAAPPGFYGLLEIDLLFPQLRGWLGGPLTVAGTPDAVFLNSANLNWTGSPRVEIGWRLADGQGAVVGSYRSVVSTGHENIPGWDFLGDGFLTSRLNMNVVDIDYASPAYHIAPFWDLAWRAGVRVAAVYFDHQVTGGFADERASSNFIGAGPHASIEVGRALDLVPGLAVTAKLDGAVVIGEVTQSFDEQLKFPGSVVGGASRFHDTQSVPVLTFTVGLSYTPPACPNWARFGFGYMVEYWWDVGSRGDSRSDLGTQGVYFRGEFNF
jgi:hypothetical protein